jgi:outer membrane protein
MFNYLSNNTEYTMKKIALLLPLLFTSHLAFAEGSGIPGTEETTATTPAAGDDWKVTLGGGLASVPRYEGASKNRLRLAPLLEVDNGHFFAGTSRGIGYNFSEDKDVKYGLRLTLAPHRNQNVDARLNGMGNVSNAAEAGAFVNAKFTNCYVTSALAAGSNGSRFELGGGYELRLSTEDKLRAGVEVNWADSKYMQTYFGVNAAQAAASGGVLTAYTSTSGVKDTALKLNWTHSYSKEWFSNAGVTAKQLGSSAKNSPLTVKNSANSASFVVGYRF